MLITIIAFLFVLGLIVLVHELGHFVVARRAGVGIDEFGLGLPPRLLGVYRDDAGRWRLMGPRGSIPGKTIWSLNWIPLGGFVKIKGEQGEAAEETDSFAHKSLGVRALILSAGVSMNIILAVVLFSIGFTIGVPQVIDDQPLPASARVSQEKIQIVEVVPDLPAAQAGIKTGDALVSVDGQAVTTIIALQEYFDQRVGVDTAVEVKRGEELLSFQVVPQVLAETNRGGMGVALAQTAIVSYPWYAAIGQGVVETGRAIVGVLVGFYLITANLLVNQNLIGEVYGPVGIASLVGDAARLGVLYLLQFTAVLSVIIAVINYLPFPALDGGRVLFLIIEAVRGRPVNQRIEGLLHNIGFALLMGLVVIVTFRDLTRVTGGLGSWLQGLF